MSGTLKTAEVRARLKHPVIDSDGHFTEYGPLLIEYITKAGGKQAVADFAAASRKTFVSMEWHGLSPSERKEVWSKRPPFFALPAANTLDLATSLFPDLLYERLDEIGLDFTVLYPGAAIGVQTFFEDDIRRLACRALNNYYADLFMDHPDRMTPVAVIPMHTPQEAIDELDYAVGQRGMRVVMLPSTIRRPIPAIAKKYPELGRYAFRLDTYGIDSDYDYDPVWAKCQELKVVPTFHGPGEGNPQFGMATIWDADILIWAATQLTEARDRGAETSPNLRFFPYDLLKAIRRGTSGQDYRDLRSALTRLAGTLVRTNIRATEKRKTAVFHWLEGWNEIVDEVKQESKGMTMTLPQWLYHGILQQGGVLTIDPDYFLLTGGVERWMYRVARKHAGHQERGWQFTMRQLYEKSGSLARFSDFAIDIRKIVKGDHLPEYTLEIGRNQEGAEIVYITPRSALAPDDPRAESPRHPRRRVMRGIYAKPLKLGDERV